MKIESLTKKYQSNNHSYSSNFKNIAFKSIDLKIPYKNQIFEIHIKFKKVNGRFIYRINIMDSSNILKSNTKKEIENI